MFAATLPTSLSQLTGPGVAARLRLHHGLAPACIKTTTRSCPLRAHCAQAETGRDREGDLIRYRHSTHIHFVPWSSGMAPSQHFRMADIEAHLAEERAAVLDIRAIQMTGRSLGRDLTRALGQQPAFLNVQG